MARVLAIEETPRSAMRGLEDLGRRLVLWGYVCERRRHRQTVHRDARISNGVADGKSRRAWLTSPQLLPNAPVDSKDSAGDRDARVCLRAVPTSV